MDRNLLKLSIGFHNIIVILDFMTSSSFLRAVTAKKVEGFLEFLLNISITAQLIFTKPMSFLGNHL